MDFKKILSASLMIIGIGVALVLVGAILAVVSVIAPASVGPIPLAVILGFVGMGYALLSFLLFAGLYAWAGMRAVKSYGLDLMGAGLVSALAHAVTCIVSIIVNIVVGMISAGSTALGMAGAGGAAVGALVGGLGFMVGTLWTLMMGGVCLFGGMLVNFGLGYLGGMLAQQKPAAKPEEKPEAAEKKAEKEKN